MRLGPNQTMKLTATLEESSKVKLGSRNVKRRLASSGRSLSFSR
jgi:hypothetical protein